MSAYNTHGKIYDPGINICASQGSEMETGSGVGDKFVFYAIVYGSNFTIK